MKKINLGTSQVEVSNIALGCMRMNNLSDENAQTVIKTALEAGINFFDHADIYGKGESESIFGRAIKALNIPRESIIIQSKCGIDQENGTYNFSKAHILSSVDKILKRLQTDYLDVLVLHRPDSLFDPIEVNEAFHILYESKKVRHFGVSNQSPAQMKLLQKHCDFDLLVNQVQFSLMHTGMIDAGFNVNMEKTYPAEGIIEYARLQQQTLQAWSPFYSGFFEDIFLDNDKFPEVNAAIDTLAKKYDVSNEAIAIAWILRHPVNFQVLIGSMNPDRIKRIVQANNITLSHKEWYDLYKAAGNRLP